MGSSSVYTSMLFHGSYNLSPKCHGKLKIWHWGYGWGGTCTIAKNYIHSFVKHGSIFTNYKMFDTVSSTCLKAFGVKYQRDVIGVKVALFI